MTEEPIQFAVVRTGVDEFKIIVQSGRSILRTYRKSYAGARNSIIEELLALEVGGHNEPNA